jgi:hypothetical protein
MKFGDDIANIEKHLMLVKLYGRKPGSQRLIGEGVDKPIALVVHHNAACSMLRQSLGSFRSNKP